MKKIVFLAIFFLTAFILIPQDIDADHTCTQTYISGNYCCYNPISTLCPDFEVVPCDGYASKDSARPNCASLGCYNSQWYYYNGQAACTTAGWDCTASWTDCTANKCENNYQSYYNGSCVGGATGSCQYSTETCDPTPGCVVGTNTRYWNGNCNTADKRCAWSYENCDNYDGCVAGTHKWADYGCGSGSCVKVSEALDTRCGAECTTSGATVPYSSGSCTGTRTCQTDGTLSAPFCSSGSTSCAKPCPYKDCLGPNESVCTLTSINITGTQTCQSDCSLGACQATCPSDVCTSDAACTCKVVNDCVSTTCYNGDVWCKNDCGRWDHISTICSDGNSCTIDSCPAGSGICQYESGCGTTCFIGSPDYCQVCARCGDGICAYNCEEITGTPKSCPQDCPAGAAFFSVSTNPVSGSVVQGSAVSATVNAVLTSGSTQPVFFAASNLPLGTSASFSPTNCNPTCSSVMTINVLATAPTGNYSINVCGTGGSQTQCVVYGLAISAPTLGVIPPSVTTATASGITPTSVTFNGTLNSLGGADSVWVWFEWGPTTSYGNSTPLQEKSAMGTFSANVSGLTPDTTYYFKARVKNGGSW